VQTMSCHALLQHALMCHAVPCRCLPAVLPPSLLKPLANRPRMPPSEELIGTTGGLGRRMFVGPASAKLLGLMGGVLNPAATPLPPPPLLLLPPWAAVPMAGVLPPERTPLPPSCCSCKPLGLLTALPPPLLIGPLPTSVSSPPPPPPPSPAASGMSPPLLLLLARRMSINPPPPLLAAALLPPPALLEAMLEDASPLQLLLRCVPLAGLETVDVDAEPLSQLNVKLSPCEPLTAAKRALKSAAAACAAAAAAAAALGVPDCDVPGMGLPLLLPVGVLGWLLPCTAAEPEAE